MLAADVSHLRDSFRPCGRWFRVVAEKGLPNAQFSLGVILMNGDRTRCP